MAYEPDLTDYQISFSHEERRFSGLPLLTIGWMEPPHPMPTGEAPAGFAERLALFCTWDKLVSLESGHQDCGYCHLTYFDHRKRLGSPLGNGEIRVIGDGVVYAAPSLICHYVGAHSYLPPAEFIAAVMNGPGPDDLVYVKYRFLWWDGTMQAAARRKGPPGSTLGALVKRYRGMVLITILMFAVIVKRPYGFLPTAVAVAVLAALWWFLHSRLRCPACRNRMQLPFREKSGWSLPPGPALDHRWSALYCDLCGVGIRMPTKLWGDPACVIVTNWK